MHDADYQQIVLDLARRVEDLELYHWRPPHGYTVVAMEGVDVKWVWVRPMTSMYPSERSPQTFDNQLDCIKDLKAHLARKEQ